MSAICQNCGKGPMSGNNVSHSHRRSNRMWKSNVRQVRVLTDQGTTAKVYVCSRCMRSGYVTRA